MCLCNPDSLTHYCGCPGCKPPKQPASAPPPIAEGIRLSLLKAGELLRDAGEKSALAQNARDRLHQAKRHVNVREAAADAAWDALRIQLAELAALCGDLQSSPLGQLLQGPGALA